MAWKELEWLSFLDLETEPTKLLTEDVVEGLSQGREISVKMPVEHPGDN